jgi:hypothetical protein
VHKVAEVLKELRVFQEPQEPLVLRVQGDRKEHRVAKVLEVLQVLRDRLDLRVLKGLRVHRGMVVTKVR